MPSTEEIAWRLLLAMVIGGILGAEREYRSKSAGFRTLALICLGACLFTILSHLIGFEHAPERIASNVVVGIGFVGAGVIFRADPLHSKVTGITTAAMIWVTAALGMCIGAGFKLISLIACLLVLIVIILFHILEGWIDRVNQIRNYKIVCPFENDTLHRFEELFRSHHLSFKRNRQSKTDDNVIAGEWIVQGSEKNHRRCVHEILRDPTVKTFQF
jgi:putative Mg2+ transporter-C (MgtC) family protein